MNRQEVTKKLLSGFAWEGSARLITQTAAWISTFWVIRLLTPDDYGIVAISGIYIGIIAVVCEMGFGYGLINKKEISEEEEDSILWIGIIISFSLYALVYFSASYIEKFYGIEHLAAIMRTAGLILIISSVKTVTMSLAMRELRYKYRAILVMSGRLTSSISSVTLAMAGFGAWSLVFSTLINHTIVAIGFAACMRRLPLLRINIKKVIPIMTYGSQLMMSNILGFITSRSATFFVSIFFGQTAVGIYSFANQLAQIPLDKAGALFNSVAFPALSRLQDDKEGFRSTFLNMHKYLLMLGFPTLLILIIFTEPLVKLILTEKWLSAVPIIKILSLINLLRLSSMLIPNVLAALGNARKVFNYNIAACIILSIGFLIGTRFGLIGVAASWLFSYPLLYIYLWSTLRKDIDIPKKTIISSVKPIITCSSILSIYGFSIIFLFEIDNIYKLAITGTGAGIIYLGSMYLFFRTEVQNIKNTILKKNK